MAYSPGSGAAIISMGVDGDADTRKRIDSVGDALDKLNGRKFQQLAEQVAGIQSNIGGLKSTLTDIAQFTVAGFGVAAFAGMIKGSIDAADNLNDLSKTTGITVSTLSGLKLAAQQSGGDLAGIASSVNKLSVNMGKDAARFTALGVTAKDPIEAFKQLANVVSAIDDPQVRAAVSAAALGRSWESSAPLLAEGGESIGKMIDKGRELAGVNQGMVDKADAFNDQMAEMGAAIDGIKMKIAADMLPALVDVTQQMNSAYKESGLLRAGLMALNGLGALAFSDEFASAEVQMKNLRSELERLRAPLELSKGAPAIGAVGRWLFGESTEALQVETDAVRAKIWALQEDIDRPAKNAAAKAAQEARDKEAKDKAAADAKAKATAFMAAEENRKAAESAAKKEADSYVGLTAAIQTKIDLGRAELSQDEALTDSQKTRIRLEQDLLTGKLKLLPAHAQTLRALLDEQDAVEDLVASRQAEKAMDQWLQQSAQARNVSNAALAVEYDLYGKSADARDVAMVAVKAEAEMERTIAAMRLAGKPVSEQMVEQMRAEKDMRVEVEQATLAQTRALGYAYDLAQQNKQFSAESISDPKARAQALLQIDADVWRERIKLAGEGTKAQQLLQTEYDAWYANRSKTVGFEVDLTQATAMLDIMAALDDSAKSAATGMANSFGTVGSAIGGLTTSLTEYGRTQAAIAAQLAASTKAAGGDQSKISKANSTAATQAAQAQMKSYGDMASAAKGFFKENSAGYRTMAGVEKSFRAAEMAMAIDNMIVKSGLISGYTGLFVAAKATETTVEAGATGASVAMAGTQASAWGITAVVKSLASLPFPWNLAAGAATLAAVVAIGASMMGSTGGGASVNPDSAEERQKVQGTGTVLGDPTAKSESMANSLKTMEKYSALGLDYQNSMLTALQNIESALGGAAKGIIQTSGITGGSAFGTFASSDSSVFGASHTKDISDSGVKFAGTFGQLRSGGGSGRQYEDVHTTSDGGMFRSGWERTDTKYKALSAEAMKPFALIFDNMGDLMADAGVKLGYDSATLASAINNVSVNFGVSLRGLTGQDLTDALNAGVSVAFDKVTTQLFPTIQQFQKMGEGLGETLVRVASDVQGVDSVFASMGKSLTTTVTRNTSSIGGWFSGIFNGVAQSVTVVTSMSIEAKERLVEASGGLEKFASSAKSFMQNFYSETEQRDATKAKLNPVLAQYGLTTEGSNAQKMFKDFVLGLDASTASGAETYAMLMNLQQAFYDVTDAVASERADLQSQLDELTMSSVQLLNKQRMALDASNRGLFDQIQAAKAAKDAQEATKASLSSLIEKMGSFGESAKTLRDSVQTGALSTLTPEQQYAQLRNQYETTVASAKGGDAKAQGNYSSIATAFLTASQKINGGDAQYTADFASVYRTSDEIAQWAAGQVDVAQASLNALNDQVTGIAALNTTMAQVALDVQGLPAALVAASAQAMAAPVNFSGMGTSGMTSLVTEIKALRAANEAMAATNAAIQAELKGLRGEQNKQTGDLITSNDKLAERTGAAIVAGVGAAVQERVTARNSGGVLE